MKFLLSIMVLLAVTRTGDSGQCRLRPLEEEVCESPLAFRGKVEKIETSIINNDWMTLTDTYTLKVKDIYRQIGVVNLKTDDLVKIIAPNQFLSTAVHMKKREEYFIRGILTEEDGNKLVDSGFCHNRPFSFLKSEDVNKLKRIQCGDDK